MVSFPARMTASAPFLRTMSCNPLEIKDPGIPPAFSGYPAADRADWQGIPRGVRTSPPADVGGVQRLGYRSGRPGAAGYGVHAFGGEQLQRAYARGMALSFDQAIDLAPGDPAGHITGCSVPLNRHATTTYEQYRVGVLGQRDRAAAAVMDVVSGPSGRVGHRLGPLQGSQGARAGAKAGAILRGPGGIPGHPEAVFGQVKCSPGHSGAGSGCRRVSLTRKRSQVQILYRPQVTAIIRNN